MKKGGQGWLQQGAGAIVAARDMVRKRKGKREKKKKEKERRRKKEEGRGGEVEEE